MNLAHRLLEPEAFSSVFDRYPKVISAYNLEFYNLVLSDPKRR